MFCFIVILLVFQCSYGWSQVSVAPPAVKQELKSDFVADILIEQDAFYVFLEDGRILRGKKEDIDQLIGLLGSAGIWNYLSTEPKWDSLLREPEDNSLLRIEVDEDSQKPYITEKWYKKFSLEFVSSSSMWKTHLAICTVVEILDVEGSFVVTVPLFSPEGKNGQFRNLWNFTEWFLTNDEDKEVIGDWGEADPLVVVQVIASSDQSDKKAIFGYGLVHFNSEEELQAWLSGSREDVGLDWVRVLPPGRIRGECCECNED